MSITDFFLQIPAPAQLSNTQFNPAPSIIPQIQIQDLGSYGFFGFLNAFFFPLVGIFAFILIGIILIRFRQNETAYYGNGVRLPNRYRIIIGDGHFDCRLTQVDPLVLEESLEIIKRIPEIEQSSNLPEAIEEIRQRVINKELFLYEAKVIDKKYIRLRGNVGYGMVLSTGNLNDPIYYTELKKGIASVASPTFREYPRMVNCLKNFSRQYNLQTTKRRIAPVFVIAPMKDPENNMETRLSDGLEHFEIPPVILQVKVLTSPKFLAQIMLILQTVGDLYENLEAKTIQADNLIKMNRVLQDKSIGKQLETDYLRSELMQQELEKIGTSEIKKEKKEGWIWLVVLLMGGFVSITLPPQIPELATMPIGAAYMLVGIVVFILKFAVERKSESPEQRMKSTERSVNLEQQ